MKNHPLSQGEYGNPGQAPSSAGFPSQSQPVTFQPAAGPWDMGGSPGSAGVIPIGVPPGLEYLVQIDQILIQQKVELLELIIGFETQNHYEIKNSLGQLVYKAKEESNCCARNICGPMRSFEMTITDHEDREVIRLIRPLRCGWSCCCCCLQEMEVQAPPGTTIGYVRQNCHPCLPRFSIQGADEETVMKLEGPFCTINLCCGDVNFELKGNDGSSIGRITKQWTGFVKEAFTDTDNFGIEFPQDMDVKIKAVLMGACFLIDFLYFEKIKRKN